MRISDWSSDVCSSDLDEIPNLPSGVQGPFFNDDFADSYFALYALESKGLPHRELVMEAERLRQRLLIVDGVRKVDILGEQAQRIYVEFSYQKLAKIGRASCRERVCQYV